MLCYSSYTNQDCHKLSRLLLSVVKLVSAGSHRMLEGSLLRRGSLGDICWMQWVQVQIEWAVIARWFAPALITFSGSPRRPLQEREEHCCFIIALWSSSSVVEQFLLHTYMMASYLTISYFEIFVKIEFWTQHGYIPSTAELHKKHLEIKI